MKQAAVAVVVSALILAGCATTTLPPPGAKPPALECPTPACHVDVTITVDDSKPDTCAVALQFDPIIVNKGNQPADGVELLWHIKTVQMGRLWMFRQERGIDVRQDPRGEFTDKGRSVGGRTYTWRDTNKYEGDHEYKVYVYDFFHPSMQCSLDPTIVNKG